MGSVCGGAASSQCLFLKRPWAVSGGVRIVTSLPWLKNGPNLEIPAEGTALNTGVFDCHQVDETTEKTSKWG
jgi:hypothetical protein